MRLVRGEQDVKKQQMEWKIKSDAKLILERGEQEVKKQQMERKIKSDAKLRFERGEEDVKKQQMERKIKSKSKLRLERGDESMRESARRIERLSRFRQREFNPQKLKDNQRNWNQQYRQNQTEERRLQRFYLDPYALLMVKK